MNTKYFKFKLFHCCLKSFNDYILYNEFMTQFSEIGKILVKYSFIQNMLKLHKLTIQDQYLHRLYILI